MNSLEEYGALFQKLGLSELEVEEGGFKLKLRKNLAEGNDGNLRTGTGHGFNAGKDFAEEVKDHGSDFLPEDDNRQISDGEPIKSPLLGIFYAANGDNMAVKEGDSVKEGDVLCTIEAMKMMNEVRSTKSGIISKVCAKEGDLVEYNQTLFMVKAG